MSTKRMPAPEYGFTACWAQYPKGRCRKPKGHDDACAPFWFHGDGPSIILFLDFDGVLHPYPTTTERLFEQVDRLREVVLARPWVGVVVHSSWRNSKHYDQDDFQEFLKLGTQYLGVTPQEVPSRWESIQAWLAPRKPFHRHVIVDDMAGSFPTEAREHLVCPHRLTGMMESDWKELERRLNAD